MPPAPSDRLKTTTHHEKAPHPRRCSPRRMFQPPSGLSQGVFPQQWHLRRAPLSVELWLPWRLQFPRWAWLNFQFRLLLPQPLLRLPLRLRGRIHSRQRHIRPPPLSHPGQRHDHRQPQLPGIRNHPRAALLSAEIQPSPLPTLAPWTRDSLQSMLQTDEADRRH